MRFLVVTTNRDPVPPELAVPLLTMMQSWVAEHTRSGKMEQVWSFAGTIGGGGILDVDSHEELDSIMGAFPFAQVSNVSIYPLADLNAALSDAATRTQGMIELMGSQG